MLERYVTARRRGAVLRCPPPLRHRSGSTSRRILRVCRWASADAAPAAQRSHIWTHASLSTVFGKPAMLPQPKTTRAECVRTAAGRHVTVIWAYAPKREAAEPVRERGCTPVTLARSFHEQKSARRIDGTAAVQQTVPVTVCAMAASLRGAGIHARLCLRHDSEARNTRAMSYASLTWSSCTMTSASAICTADVPRSAAPLCLPSGPERQTTQGAHAPVSLVHTLCARAQLCSSSTRAFRRA